jgi:enoyl-CoA hydratase/carnithine racemase
MTIAATRAGPAAVIRIDRPEARGALRLVDWQALADAIAAAMADAAVRSLVLTGTGAAFCAGADIREIADRAGDAAWAGAKYEAVRACNRALATGPKPAIAAIGGDAIGGGCGLALACDLRIVAPTARMGVTPARLGIAYGRFDTALLAAATGLAEARRLVLTAALVDAEEAVRIGLAQRIAADPLAAAMAEAEALASLSAEAQAHSKAMLAAMLPDDDAASRAAFVAAYASEGLQARARGFADRRG